MPPTESTPKTPTWRPRHFIYRAVKRAQAPVGPTDQTFITWWRRYRWGSDLGHVWVPTTDRVLRGARPGDVVWFIFDDRLHGGAVITSVDHDIGHDRWEIAWDSAKAWWVGRPRAIPTGLRREAGARRVPAKTANAWHRFPPPVEVPPEVPVEALVEQVRQALQEGLGKTLGVPDAAPAPTRGSLIQWGPTQGEADALRALSLVAHANVHGQTDPSLALTRVLHRGEPRTLLGLTSRDPGGGTRVRPIALLLRAGDEVTFDGNRPLVVDGPSDPLRGTDGPPAPSTPSSGGTVSPRCN